MSRQKLAGLVAGIMLILGVGGWAFQWRYDHVQYRSTLGEYRTSLVRTNRFTSNVQVFDERRGWVERGSAGAELDRVVDDILAKHR